MLLAQLSPPRIFLSPETMADVPRRVLIISVPFGEHDLTALRRLRAAGLAYDTNPLGRHLSESELVALIPPFGALIAGTEPITAAVMDKAPHLKIIARVGIGLDSVDLPEARRRGIDVTYTPDAPAPAVAELALGLMLSLLRGIQLADRSMRTATWSRFMGRRLAGSTVGVIGVGRVGSRLIRLMHGFSGVSVLANDIEPDRVFGQSHGVSWVDKETLFRESDVVSVHVPLTPDTYRLVDHEALSTMKPTAFLINTARGGIVDEGALASAIREGQVAGAAIDVYESEPYTGELTSLENCLLTCHMGSMTDDCRLQMEQEAVDDVVRFFSGQPLARPVPSGEYDVVAVARPSPQLSRGRS